MSDDKISLQREVKSTISGLFSLTFVLKFCSWFSILCGILLFVMSEVGLLLPLRVLFRALISMVWGGGLSDKSIEFRHDERDDDSPQISQRSNSIENHHIVSNEDNENNVVVQKIRPDEVAIYRNNCCVYADGTPAPVMAGHLVRKVPHEYVVWCKGDVEKAKIMYNDAQQWRMEENIYKIHTLPHPHFWIISECYPLYLHGYTKMGNPISWEMAGKIKSKKLFADGRAKIMYRAYSFYLEFIFNVICRRKEITERRTDSPPFSGQMFCCILDLEGFNMGMLTFAAAKYCMEVTKINEKFYPLSGQQAIFVNAPNWLAESFSLIRHLFPENNRDTIVLLTKAQTKELQNYIDIDQIPCKYGGSSPFELGEHPYMKEFYALVNKANEKNM